MLLSIGAGVFGMVVRVGYFDYNIDDYYNDYYDDYYNDYYPSYHDRNAYLTIVIIENSALMCTFLCSNH